MIRGDKRRKTAPYAPRPCRVCGDDVPYKAGQTEREYLNTVTCSDACLFRLQQQNALHMVGPGDLHPMYDFTEYEWVHTDGRREICTKFVLARKYNLPSSIYLIENGKKKSCKGWTLLDNLAVEGFVYGPVAPSGEAHYAYDTEERLWRNNHLGIEHNGTIDDLLIEHDPNPTMPHAMKRKRLLRVAHNVPHYLSAFGWYLPALHSEPPLDYEYDDVVRLWRNHDGIDDFYGTVDELIEGHPPASKMASAHLRKYFIRVTRQRADSAFGWYLPAHHQDPSGQCDRNAEAYHWRHLDGRSYSGTIDGLIQRYGLTDRNYLNAVARGRYKAAYGWYIDDKYHERPTPKFQDEPRLWMHRDGRKISGLIDDVMKEACRTNPLVARAPFVRVTEGKRKAAYDWYLPAQVSVAPPRRRKGADHYLANNTQYRWRHRDGRTYSGTVVGLVETQNPNPSGNILTMRRLLRLVAEGKRQSGYGWALDEGLTALSVRRRTDVDTTGTHP